MNHKDWINGPRAVVWGVGYRSAISSAEADTAKAPSPTAKWVIVVRKAGLVVLIGMDTELRFCYSQQKERSPEEILFPKIESLLFLLLNVFLRIKLLELPKPKVIFVFRVNSLTTQNEKYNLSFDLSRVHGALCSGKQ